VKQVEAVQLRALDATLGMNYLEAKQAGNDKLAEFLLSRVRPELKPAFDAWLKSDPLTNPSAPLTPFVMPEFRSLELQQAKDFEQQAQLFSEANTEASGRANNFVLLTLLFATTLFLGGLANSLPSPRLEHIVSLGALLVFATTVIRLLTLQVAPWS
jgi:hypothetical protein